MCLQFEYNFIIVNSAQVKKLQSLLLTYNYTPLSIHAHKRLWHSNFILIGIKIVKKQCPEFASLFFYKLLMAIKKN